MFTRMMLLAACGLAFALAVQADEPAKKAEKSQVREIDLKGVKPERPNGRVDKPTVITRDEELAQAFPDADAQKKIKKEVDFKKEKLLYFAWGGSGQDRLTFNKVEKGEKGAVVVFDFRRGLTRDFRPHTHLFAVPKDATWRLDPVK